MRCTTWPRKVLSRSSSECMATVRGDIISPEALDGLKDYYKRSEGYKEHLAGKTEAYFAGYVGVLCSVTKASDLVLDLGCGTGTSTRLIAGRGRSVVGCDISSLFLRSGEDTTRGCISFAAADAARLPFPDGGFDAVGAMEFIEHVWPVEPVLREMARVIKPEGRLIISSPNLLSPLWPLRDLPGMLRRGRFRPPHYTNFGEALSYFLSCSATTAKKYCSKRPNFLPRHPEIVGADGGGDFDAAYFAHPRDIILFMRSLGFVAEYARGQATPVAMSAKMRLASLLGGLWGSFTLVAKRAI